MPGVDKLLKREYLWVCLNIVSQSTLPRHIRSHCTVLGFNWLNLVSSFGAGHFSEPREVINQPRVDHLIWGGGGRYARLGTNKRKRINIFLMPAWCACWFLNFAQYFAQHSVERETILAPKRHGYDDERIVSIAWSFTKNVANVFWCIYIPLSSKAIPKTSRAQFELE